MYVLCFIKKLFNLHKVLVESMYLSKIKALFFKMMMKKYMVPYKYITIENDNNSSRSSLYYVYGVG